LRLFLGIIFTLACASTASAQQHPPSARAALTLVSRFVAAQTTFDAVRAASFLSGCEDGGADDQQVTTSVRFLTPVPHQDTMIVAVIYQVAGRFWSDDPHRAGPHYAHFESQPRVDTVAYSVFADPRGRRWIDCGHFGINHVAASHLARYMKAFDDSSLVAWRTKRLPLR
jgi:hypothetical protein